MRQHRNWQGWATPIPVYPCRRQGRAQLCAHVKRGGAYREEIEFLIYDCSSPNLLPELKKWHQIYENTGIGFNGHSAGQRQRKPHVLTDIKMRQGMEPWLCGQSQCAAPKVTERRNTRRHLCRGAQIKKIRTFELF